MFYEKIKMFASTISPPLDHGKMHFANVVDEWNNSVKLVVEGSFTCAPMTDKFNSSIKKIFFKPSSEQQTNSVDDIFEMEEFGPLPGYKISKSTKDGSLCLKIPSEINLDEAKGRSATVTLVPGLFFNSEDKKAGSFYKLIEVKF